MSDVAMENSQGDLSEPLDRQEYKKKKGRIQALLLMLVLILPMAAAYIMFHWQLGLPSGTVNKGQLITPAVDLTKMDLNLDATNKILASGKKWRLLIPITSTCNEQCLKKLYTTRQVHIRLGNKANRVERWALIDGSVSPEKYQKLTSILKPEHPRLNFSQVDLKSFNKAISSSDLSGYFLMDQEGFVMMEYQYDQGGNDLLADVKKMLKVTYEK